MATPRNRNNALVLLNNLREMGYTDAQMLTMIMNDFLSGEQAYGAVEYLYDEFGLNGGENEEIDE